MDTVVAQVDRFTDRWLTALDGTTDALVPRPQLRAFLATRSAELSALLQSTGTPTAADIARQLVDANLHTLAAIQATMAVMVEDLPDLVAHSQARRATVIAELSAGF